MHPACLTFERLGRAATRLETDMLVDPHLRPTTIQLPYSYSTNTMANWYQPPAPAPLDLPEPVPHHHQPPRSFPDFPAPDLFPLQGLQLPIHEHSPASPAASLPDSPAPPLKGLASKFALMMGRGTSPVPSSGGGGGGGSWEATPPTPIRGHGYSKSLGHPASFGWEQPDEGVLSGDEIERLAREERDWSRREAERLMVLENQARAKGQSFSPGLPLDQQEEKTPRVRPPPTLST